MAWSYEDNRFEVTGCEPRCASAGEAITVAVEGHNRGTHREEEARWYATLVPVDDVTDSLDAHLRASHVSYRHVADDRFAMAARFDLPPESHGRYQLVLGRDDTDGAGEHARFFVDADDFDGAFVIS